MGACAGKPEQHAATSAKPGEVKSSKTTGASIAEPRGVSASDCVIVAETGAADLEKGKTPVTSPVKAPAQPNGTQGATSSEGASPSGLIATSTIEAMVDNAIAASQIIAAMPAEATTATPVGAAKAPATDATPAAAAAATATPAAQSAQAVPRTTQEALDNVAATVDEMRVAINQAAAHVAAIELAATNTIATPSPATTTATAATTTSVTAPAPTAADVAPAVVADASKAAPKVTTTNSFNKERGSAGSRSSKGNSRVQQPTVASAAKTVGAVVADVTAAVAAPGGEAAGSKRKAGSGSGGGVVLTPDLASFLPPEPKANSNKSGAKRSGSQRKRK